jgi:hypothetical protein
MLQSMPREVQDAIDAFKEPGAEISLSKPRLGSSAHRWWMVELFPSTRAVLFRPDDPRSPVIWGEVAAGPGWLLARVENDQHELVGGRFYDMGGRVVREHSVERYHSAHRKLEIGRVVISWNQDKRLSGDEHEALLKFVGTETIPTREYLDELLALIRQTRRDVEAKAATAPN